MSKEKQTSDSENSSIQKVGQAGVDVRKAAPIQGWKPGNAVPPKNEGTR